MFLTDDFKVKEPDQARLNDEEVEQCEVEIAALDDERERRVRETKLKSHIKKWDGYDKLVIKKNKATYILKSGLDDKGDAMNLIRGLDEVK